MYANLKYMSVIYFHVYHLAFIYLPINPTPLYST